MKELNWEYDKDFKEWDAGWSTERSAFRFTISKPQGGLRPLYDKITFVGSFRKLKNAKEVARLLAFG